MLKGTIDLGWNGADRGQSTLDGMVLTGDSRLGWNGFDRGQSTLGGMVLTGDSRPWVEWC